MVRGWIDRFMDAVASRVEPTPHPSIEGKGDAVSLRTGATYELLNTQDSGDLYCYINMDAVHYPNELTVRTYLRFPDPLNPDVLREYLASEAALSHPKELKRPPIATADPLFAPYGARVEVEATSGGSFTFYYEAWLVESPPRPLG